MHEQKPVCIIGAGLSGLIAAFELEKAGYTPLILEASDGVGGRVRTDAVKGFLCDRGFQVLNTAYPEAQRYLDYDSLQLKKFAPGAIVLKPGSSFAIHDPLRDPMKLFGMAFSEVGSLTDKVKIFTLTNKLKGLSDEEIFAEESQPTLQFLKEYGFSDIIINNFFKPFFKGIFLENDLSTSSRMFKFVFKMFALGHAAVPEKGMGQISEQLKSKLRTTEIRLNTPVESIQGTTIALQNGEVIEAKKVIVACRPDKLIPQMSGQVNPYRKVINVYFALDHSFTASPMISLVTDPQFIINNLVFMTDVSKAYAPKGKALLSVSVVQPVKNNEQLISMIGIELEALTGISASYFEHVTTYELTEALPDVQDMKGDITPTQAKLMDGVFLAGDYMLNASINAAMTSGRRAAEALILSEQPPL
ncbi:NAD(P)/FAD-dependent oxidoreductase [Mongoliitalea daihaiensis]|uniref:NAD(P)/FAD-dependent oxidoreductase n=1 Tax=Mongoliitalea daihaiensis TaxID=2782006 RepID=UPI001F2FE996|nr:NAD(P)/FAD-dependent oxidoreductase [Mongoliitalea daihaiensis]UJP64148.1 FAD-dependent oxidoreductase [Mongoliitalea daihaiensis]